uniref:Photosystem I reaction center subunit N, chloroplastic n=1 Tax=Picea sitchensis TaxID=3332 RepID=B8LK70_PICSI|nr:unknown [Picea sitchensis]
MAGGMLATAPSSITAATHLCLGAHAEGNPLKASVHSPKSLSSLPKLGSRRLVIRAESSSGNANGRRAAVVGLGAALLSAIATSGSANAGLVEDLLVKSAANKALNDKKRLATSGANIARAYTVQFGTCQVPYNFTGCQDLAKIKNVPFLSEDMKLECEGKDKYCGSNVFWKW